MGLAGASIVVIVRICLVIPIVLDVNLILFVYEADIDNDPHKKQKHSNWAYYEGDRKQATGCFAVFTEPYDNEDSCNQDWNQEEAKHQWIDIIEMVVIADRWEVNHFKTEVNKKESRQEYYTTFQTATEAIFTGFHVITSWNILVSAFKLVIYHRVVTFWDK